MRSSRQAPEGVVERLDPQHGELLVVGDAGLGVDHVPVLGDRRVVDLQDQPGIEDRLVFLAHRVGAGEEELLVGLVIAIGDARGAARSDRGHEPFLDPRRRERRLEAGDVGLDRVVADIGNLSTQTGEGGRGPVVMPLSGSL